MDDRQIVQRIITYGDTKSFALIVRKYSPIVLSKALGIVKDRELAAEITQQTFIRAYDRLDTWQGQQLGPWLTTIACHQSINYLDKARRRRTQPIDNLPLADEPYSNEREEMLLQLEKAIDELPEQDRRIIRMHYYERLKTDEIATQTGLSQQNVLVKLHRIRERLKKTITDYGNER